MPQNLSDTIDTLLITVSVINILDLEEPFKVIQQYNLRFYLTKVKLYPNLCRSMYQAKMHGLGTRLSL